MADGDQITAARPLETGAGRQLKGVPQLLFAITIVLVFVVMGATAAPAPSADMGGITFSWEFNLTTVTVFVTGAFAWWLTVARQGDKVTAHATAIAELKLELAKKVEAETLDKLAESVEGWKMKALALEHSLTALKEEVYKEYLSKDAFREIKNELRDDAAGTEKRLMNALKDLSERVDRFAQGKSTSRST